MEEWLVPSEQHIADLAARMRSGDVQEVLAFSGMDPRDAIEESIKYSVECGAWVIDGQVACMAGVSRPAGLSKFVMPWLLSSDLVPGHKKRFLIGTKAFVEDWRTRYPYMMNFVDSRYDAAVRWVRWLGFTVHPEEYIRNDVVFYKFDMVS